MYPLIPHSGLPIIKYLILQYKSHRHSYCFLAVRAETLAGRLKLSGSTYSGLSGNRIDNQTNHFIMHLAANRSERVNTNISKERTDK